MGIVPHVLRAAAAAAAVAAAGCVVRVLLSRRSSAAHLARFRLPASIVVCMYVYVYESTAYFLILLVCLPRVWVFCSCLLSACYLFSLLPPPPLRSTSALPLAAVLLAHAPNCLAIQQPCVRI